MSRNSILGLAVCALAVHAQEECFWVHAPKTPQDDLVEHVETIEVGPRGFNGGGWTVDRAGNVNAFHVAGTYGWDKKGPYRRWESFGALGSTHNLINAVDSGDIFTLIQIKDINVFNGTGVMRKDALDSWHGKVNSIDLDVNGKRIRHLSYKAYIDTVPCDFQFPGQ